MSLSINNLSKNYGNQKAVDQISFSVNKAEIVGFLGPNGAGKSTTMKMITGYLPPDEGEISVCGIAVSGNSIETKKKVGYLPEANPLYGEMYVREYLQFIAAVHQIKNSSSRIEEVIAMVGLLPEANKKIGQLSKGYKQRVGLAAALVHDPEVLILDEPTSGLDPNQIIEIRDVIRKLGKDKTILFSSHIMQEVEAICDRVIIINQGKIVADDNLQRLKNLSTGKQFVIVEFKQAAESSLFKNIAGISSINSNNQTLFNIQCDSADEVKKQILTLSIQNNLDIISIRSEAQNLESIFKSLTS